MPIELFVQRKGEWTGPYSPSELKRMAQNGEIDPADVIRKGADGKPIPAVRVKGLLPNSGQALPEPDVHKEKVTSLIVRSGRHGIERALGGLSTVASKIATTKTGLAPTTRDGEIEPNFREVSVPQPWSIPIPPEHRNEVIIPRSDELELVVNEPFRDCPFCGETIKTIAKKCKHCGEILDVALKASLQPQHAPVINITNTTTATVGSAGPFFAPRWSPLTAALLSLILPGLGQIYKGQPVNGIAWFAITVLGYAAFIVPGVVLHICCVAGAAMGDPYR